MEMGVTFEWATLKYVVKFSIRSGKSATLLKSKFFASVVKKNFKKIVFLTKTENCFVKKVTSLKLVDKWGEAKKNL